MQPHHPSSANTPFDPVERWFDICVEERDLKRTQFARNALSLFLAAGGGVLALTAGVQLVAFYANVFCTLSPAIATWGDVGHVYDNIVHKDLPMLGDAACSLAAGGLLLINEKLHDPPQTRIRNLQDERARLECNYPRHFSTPRTP